MLQYLILLPLAGAIASYLAGRRSSSAPRVVALGVSLLTLSMAWLTLRAAPAQGFMREQLTLRWIPTLDISFALGADALSAALVALTALLFLVSVLASWGVEHRAGSYHAYLLCMLAGLMGVFTALDLFLFFLFWEIVLIPAFMLVNGWGGENRKYAAMKLLIYTHLGSLLMLVGFLLMYAKVHTFSMLEMRQLLSTGSLEYRTLVFLLVFAGFAFKIPLVPFHSWLPDAYTQAPTPVTILLAGVLSKMGAYGLVRVALGILPAEFAVFAKLIAVMALVSVFYAAFCALAQEDVKRLLAFSSLSHMGFLVLGVASLSAIGMKGAIFQMVSHGLIIALLFFCAGMLASRGYSLRISRLGGVLRSSPLLGWVIVFASLASLGLPGLSGFVAELSILLGLFSGFPALAGIAVLSLALTAGYYLWFLQRSIFGGDAGLMKGGVALVELVPVALLVLLITLLGVYPAPFMELVNGIAGQLVNAVAGGA